ncbi:hypothetical protein RN001_003113 [Aquatica leii]|uniref:Sodium channel protein Nach n=1 Tax=Aquatica leii TaxID=1421715 RepID=A0AAN7PHU6_9COLE|nr:hypothetical protein RN001_003113 [Aquatica leii]
MKQTADLLVDFMKSYNIKESVFDDITSNLSSLITTDELGNMTEYGQVYELLQNIYSTDRMMSKLTQPCSRMLKECYWKSNEISCNILFRKIKTTQGFCCGFNHYGTFDISDLVAREPVNNSYFSGGTGPALGLKVIMDLEEDQYKSSIKPVYGFNVAVQPPTDFPEMNLLSYSLEASEDLTLSVTPKLFVSAKSIRSVPLKRRQCLFPDEGTLEWTNVYSYKTCTSECKARAIYQYCKCWPYYYPLLKSLRICSLLDVKCLGLHKYNYSTMNDDPEDDDELSTADKCNCYPQCNEIQYTLHSDRAKATPMQDYFNTNYSILNVHYDTVGCHKTEKDVYNTWDRALSSVGGIVGFCIGGSIITVIEIVFFFCQSIFYTLRKKPKVTQINTINQDLYTNFKPNIQKTMMKPLKNFT